MIKGFKYRIYPTKEQAILIHKHIGCSRFIYNLALETKSYAYNNYNHSYSYSDLSSELKHLKKDHPWLKEVNSQTLQAALKDLDRAYSNFFKGIAQFPKYKSRNNPKRSFRIPQNVSIEDNRLHIPKMGKKGIKVAYHRLHEGIIKNATISYHSSGKYFVSLTCDDGKPLPSPNKITKDDIVGIDMGLKDFYVTSTGERLSTPKYYRKSESKLRYLQRIYSKYKGKRTKEKIAKLHLRISDQRKDFLHKASTKLVSDNTALAIEDLSVKNMIKNRRLSKSIADVGWGVFRTMLEYKSAHQDKELLVINRYEPSSKKCNCCGHINRSLQLSDRVWTCSVCKTEHDRDLNAALNIRDMAYKEYANKMLSGTDSKKAKGVAEAGLPSEPKSVDSRSVENVSMA